MLTWVLYDIAKDRARDKAAKACLKVGLYRVQKSVFLGTLAENERDELVMVLEGLIDNGAGLGLRLPDVPARLLQGDPAGPGVRRGMVCDEVRALLI